MVWSGLFHTHPLSLLEFVYGFYYDWQQGARERKGMLLLMRVVRSRFKCSGRQMGMNGIEKFVSSKRFMEKAISA